MTTRHLPLLALALWATASLGPAADPRVTVEREAWVMGTRLGVTVVAEGEAPAVELAETVLQEVERMDRLLSTWDVDTPLSRANRATPGHWVPVDEELAHVLIEAQRWAGRTGGAFEPRVGALVDAWDLRGDGGLPTDAELAESLIAVGPDGIQVEAGRMRRSHASAWIDSGAFGKGAALRAAASLVMRAPDGANQRVLADLGGQLLILVPSGESWSVDVAHPVERARSAAKLAVHRGSVATTGTSERGRHVLDPRTGVPVDAWGSVTVVHDDPLAADILSTALFVMGPEEGLQWAHNESVAALFLQLQDGHVSARWTPELDPFLLDLYDSKAITDPQNKSIP